MACVKVFIALLLLLCNLSVALTEATASCYRIEPWTIAGIVCVDVLLTIFIVCVTYRCAIYRHKKVENANKVYMNVRANCKKT